MIETEALILHDEQGRRYAVARAAAEPLFDFQGEIERIVCAVARAAGVTPAQIRSHRRCRVFARPRQIACWLAERHTTHSYPEIARRFGGRDHTTIMHAVRAVDARIAAGDPETLEIVERAEAEITKGDAA